MTDHQSETRASPDSEPVFVQVVRGKPYAFSGPLRTGWYLILAPVFVFALTLNWIHLAGVLPVLFIGLMGANPRFSPVGGGCLPFLLFVGIAVLTIWRTEIGIILILWAVVAWIVASCELRLTMKPYENPAVTEES